MDTATFKTEQRRMIARIATEINELNTLYAALVKLKGVRQPNHTDTSTTRWVHLIQARNWNEALKWLYENGLSELPLGTPDTDLRETNGRSQALQ